MSKLKGNFLISLLLIAAISIGIGLPLLVIDKFIDEDRNYKLMDKVHVLASEIKKYKEKNKEYPENILVVRNSDKLCVTRFYRKCRRVYYKPSANLQDFKLALRSFTPRVLFYHPEVSMTTGEADLLPKETRQKRINQYGQICFFCYALPHKYLNLLGNNLDTPTYRETPPIFADPDEWPILKKAPQIFN